VESAPYCQVLTKGGINRQILVKLQNIGFHYHSLSVGRCVPGVQQTVGGNLISIPQGREGASKQKQKNL
jgi:hypothetical protein